MSRGSESGMTLMELLVALVIGTLVLTLVVQGLGLALGLYDRVIRTTTTMDVAFREQTWWTDSVGSLVACTDTGDCLTGDDKRFEAYTFQGLLTPSGQRVAVRWTLAETPEGHRLTLTEFRGSDEPQQIVLKTTLPAGASFGYRDENGRWRRQWNAAFGETNAFLPTAIRIEAPDGSIHGWASVNQRRMGKPHVRDLLDI